MYNIIRRCSLGVCGIDECYTFEEAKLIFRNRICEKCGADGIKLFTDLIESYCDEVYPDAMPKEMKQLIEVLTKLATDPLYPENPESFEFEGFDDDNIEFYSNPWDKQIFVYVNNPEYKGRFPQVEINVIKMDDPDVEYFWFITDDNNYLSDIAIEKEDKPGDDTDDGHDDNEKSIGESMPEAATDGSWKMVAVINGEINKEYFSSFVDARMAFRKRIEASFDYDSLCDFLDIAGDELDRNEASNFYNISSDIREMVYNYNYLDVGYELSSVDYENDVVTLMSDDEKVYVDSSDDSGYPYFESNIHNMTDPNKLYFLSMHFKGTNLYFELEREAENTEDDWDDFPAEEDVIPEPEPISEPEPEPEEIPDFSDDVSVKYDVIISTRGASDIQLIKAIREITGCGMAEAADMLSDFPITLLKEVGKFTADSAKAHIAATGADVEVVEAGASVIGSMTSCNVVLLSVGDSKINVIKAVREVTGLGMGDAMSLVSNLPATVAGPMGKIAADAIKAHLEAAGASVVLR